MNYEMKYLEAHPISDVCLVLYIVFMGEWAKMVNNTKIHLAQRIDSKTDFGRDCVKDRLSQK